MLNPRKVDITAEFPSSLNFLFAKHQYKVARGGRGSGKSWAFSRALLILGMQPRKFGRDQDKLRILCAREVQLSIKQSVHKLLKDQIDRLELGHFYTVLDTEIRGINGTEFAFTGLSSLTVDTIKSYEGVDICWVEEGQAISKRSWEILDPTIRKKGSEIWISYNPELETDETHQRFTVNCPRTCRNVLVNWRDNPWFNDLMDQKRLRCKEITPDDYENIWEGKCRPAVAGAIYHKQIQEAEINRRICNVPYDPMLKVHIVLDLGWEDSLAAGLVQRHASEIRIIEYLEANQTKLDAFFHEIRLRGYNWGKVWLPHDGFAKTLNADGKSTEDILKSLKWDVSPKEETTIIPVEEGIRHVRLQFHRIYFDDYNCASNKPLRALTSEFKPTDLSWRLVEILKRYRRHINKQTEAPGSPVHDQYAHGADMLRYICINADRMSNEDLMSVPNIIKNRRKAAPSYMMQ